MRCDIFGKKNVYIYLKYAKNVHIQFEINYEEIFISFNSSVISFPWILPRKEFSKDIEIDRKPNRFKQTSK